MRQVAVVVDGAIELPPELVRQLDIVVVPRPVRVGWTRRTLDESYTGYSLAAEQPVPGRLSLGLPELGAFQEAYRRAQAMGRDILSIHLPEPVDECAVRARLARNLLAASNHIVILESPLFGQNLARLVEVAGRVALPRWTPWLAELEGEAVASALPQGGWNRAELHELLRVLIIHARTLLVTPTGSRLRPRVALGGYEVVPGRFQELGRAPTLDRLASRVAQEVAAVKPSPVSLAAGEPYLEVAGRQVRMASAPAALETALAELEGVEPGEAPLWSPALTALVERRHVELSCFPTARVLARLIRLTLRVQKSLAGRSQATSARGWVPIADRVKRLSDT